MWLAGGFLMAWMASENFRSADRLLTVSDPAAMVRLRALDPGQGRALLRHQVAEQNRDLFETWEFAQFFLGIFFLLLLLLGTSEGKFPLALAAFMLLLVLPQRLWLTPAMDSLGTAMDFAPGGGSRGEHARFLILHGSYIGIELVKWAAGIVLALILITGKRRRSHSRHSREKVDLVDKPNYRHIDR
jgi:hypothetical protein